MSEADNFPLVIVDSGLWTLDFTHVRIVPPDDVPEPYRRLLVHHHHMTVTVEDFIYMGTGYKCKFRLADGCEGVARIPNVAGLDIAVGQKAWVEWDVERGVLLDAG